MNQEELKQLKVTALHCRQNVLRMIKANGSGHLGPAFSCMDIVTALYFHVMDVDPKNPEKEDRDRFLLSAGHKGMAQYAALAEKGFFDKEILDTFGQFKCRIPGHPDMHKLPGIEANTGSLGHGLNLACGMALALRQDGKKSRVFVLTGDGELAEGSNWEAAAVAAQYKLDNLCVIVDANGLQISGHTKDVMSFEPITDHFAGFGWAVTEVDGNDMEKVVETFEKLPLESGKPNLIVARDIKAKGFAELEGKVGCHYWAPTPDAMERAEKELEEAIKEVLA
jgi:transketolase